MHKTQITADYDKVQQLGLYLTLDSPAEEWYINIGSQIRTWADFETKFRSRFPGVQKIVKYCARLKSDWSPAGSDEVRWKGLGFNL
jgi:hypothetical protein